MRPIFFGMLLSPIYEYLYKRVCWQISWHIAYADRLYPILYSQLAV